MAYVDIYTGIYNKLIQVTANVYKDQAPVNAVFPYITYYIIDGTMDSENGEERIMLVIDLWDNITDTTRLENLMDLIETSLHRKFISQASYTINFFKENRFDVPANDDIIKRKQVRFYSPTYRN